jgi:hypothetical protein
MAPIALAGLTQVAVIKLGGLKSLAARPLDFGATWRGRRLLGDNKTWRGVVVMVVATAGWAALLEWLASLGHWSVGGAVPFEAMHPLGWGALAGAGYVAGELPNSFIKRRLEIAPGAPAPAGLARAAFWTVDQVDSLAGVLVFLWAVWQPSGAVVLCLVGVTLLVHPAVAFIMLGLGLKSRVG